MFNNGDIINYIDIVFSVICMKRHLAGALFLSKAIELTVMDSSYVYKGLMKKLYPEVARLCGTNPHKVERDVRYAIDDCYKSGKLVLLNKVFKANIFDANFKPKNGEFIALIADKIRLRLNYGKILSENEFHLST